MSFSSDSGYVPATFETLMAAVMTNINTQFGTTYTYETFVGTNFYKYFYALIQKLQENEIKTSEIFLKLQDYFATTNDRIQRPVMTAPGLIEALSDNNYVSSVKAPIDADAGKVYICVNLTATDPTYATQVIDVATIIKNSVAAGVVTQGAVSTNLVLSNGQTFAFKFKLPTLIPVKLRLTITLSVNNQAVIDTPEVTKALLLANIAAKYGLGKNFEPQKYFTMQDAPWASIVLLEWSSDAGSTWHSTVYSAAYDDLFTYALADITLVEV